MFVSNSKQNKEEMLAKIGVSSFEELVKQVPAQLRTKEFGMEPALNEQELIRHSKELAAKNKKLLNFAGGGAYEHFIPSALSQIVNRGEFLTAYTPYQAEASQGTLQAIYEFQSSICALFDMEATNASMYEAATALAEAVNACVKASRKTKVLLAQALNPDYVQTVKTYFKHAGVSFDTVNCTNGQLDLNDLKAKLTADVACVAVANPNYYGCVEKMHEISQAVHDAKSHFIAVVEPLSLGVLAAPGEYNADIAVAEAQSLGTPLNYGGPFLGVFACNKEFLRHIPGRICGITKDTKGQRAFVLTLQAREQHIRRERASSNICSNEALCALSATIYMALLGPQGMKEVAEINLENAHILAEKISQTAGFKLKYNTPFFNEFVVECPKPAEEIIGKLAAKDILAGISLGGNDMLICATETKTAADLDAFVKELAEVSK